MGRPIFRGYVYVLGRVRLWLIHQAFAANYAVGGSQRFLGALRSHRWVWKAILTRKLTYPPKKCWLLEEHFPVEIVPFQVTFVHCQGGNLVISLFGIFWKARRKRPQKGQPLSGFTDDLCEISILEYVLEGHFFSASMSNCWLPRLAVYARFCRFILRRRGKHL